MAGRVLGLRWSESELRVFYNTTRARGFSNSSSSGVQWDKLEDKLPARTPAMVRALFDVHCGYLSQPEASVEGFCAVAATYYDGLDELAGDKQAPSTPSDGASVVVAAAAAPDADIKMEEVQLEPGSATTEIHHSGFDGDQQHKHDQGADAAKRIRKREDSLTPSSANATAADIANALLLPTSSSSSAMKDKKKRKLDRVLAWDAAGDQLDKQAQLQLQIKSDDEGGGGHARTRSNISRVRTGQQQGGTTQSAAHTSTKSPSSRSRTHLRDVSLSKQLRGKKFALPWYNWFYSYVDSDFFSHNEFIDCLHRMGLGKIKAAARPIWSSVRASMGRPRRLSARFFVQEKAKLDNYRAIKRRIGPHKAPEGWPFRCVAPLTYGVAVVVNLESPRRFAFGSVQNYSPGDGKCSVKLSPENAGNVVSCSIDSVMVLGSDSLVKHEHEEDPQTSTQSQQAVSNAFQHNPSGAGSASKITGSWTNGDWASTLQSQHRQQGKIRAVLAVKDLLHRKEQLVAALAKLNNRVGAEQQEATGPGRVAVTDQSMLHVDTSSSWPAAGDRSILQRQYAWIVVNLDITNRSLQEALVRLQECSGSAQLPSSLGAQPHLSIPPASQPQAMDSGGIESSSETLSLQQMKWAVSFLAQSRKRSSDLVAASISQMGQNEGGNMLPSSSSSNMASPPMPLPLGVLPETTQLISTCVCLMSVVRSGTSSTASPGVPPLVTQKLMERLLELLMPRHDANMDLYAELLSAAEGVQTTLQSASMN